MQQLLDDMVNRLSRALGEKLRSVILYGPAAHEDEYQIIGNYNLLIVIAELGPETLRQVGPPLRGWLKKKQPWPRLLSPQLIRDARDIYPIELSYISRHHRILLGEDPLTGVEIARDKLRLQCERELREKLMRLAEAYVECDGRKGRLRMLLAASYASFVMVFRGCLQLFGDAVPTRDHEVVAAFCRLLGLDIEPFDAISRIATGGSAGAQCEDLFANYYLQLTKAVSRIDRLDTRQGSEATST